MRSKGSQQTIRSPPCQGCSEFPATARLGHWSPWTWNWPWEAGTWPRTCQSTPARRSGSCLGRPENRDPWHWPARTSQKRPPVPTIWAVRFCGKLDSSSLESARPKATPNSTMTSMVSLLPNGRKVMSGAAL